MALFTTRLIKSKPLTINTTKPWSPIGTNVQLDYSNNKNKHLELSSSLKDAKTRTHLIGKKKKNLAFNSGIVV